MSTYAKIIVKVTPEYKGSIAKFTIGTLDPKSKRNDNSVHIDEDIQFQIDKDYICSYISHDGQPSGTGWGLYNELNSYEDILLYALQGHRSSFNVPYYKCGETWEENRPELNDSIELKGSDYYYVYDEFEGKYQWAYCIDCDHTLILLDNIFKDKVEQLKKYKKLEIIKANAEG